MTKRTRREVAKKRPPLILVVDDVEDNRIIYVEYLLYAGYRVATAADGKQAIAKARRARPALIVMDLSLPILDGWQATRRLKADPRTCGIPILALTGHGEARFRERARRAGVDRFLLKPCLPSDLAIIVSEYLGGHETTEKTPDEGLEET